jgi:DNA-binding IclR family transcriptional regulator
MSILHAFDETHLELGVTALSQKTGLDKSTVHRLLGALQQGGLIEQNSETSKYHLGFGLVRLARLALHHLDLPRIARPHLEELGAYSQETVNLSIMTDDDKIINIDRIASPRRVRNVGWIGREMPPHAVSGGKVIMAYMPQERLNRVLARGLLPITEHTVTEPAELRKQFDEIRELGYATTEEELELGLSAVAAPVWGQEGEIAAIISISGPSFRLPKERLVELGQKTKKAASRISAQLGYTG